MTTTRPLSRNPMNATATHTPGPIGYEETGHGYEVAPRGDNGTLDWEREIAVFEYGREGDLKLFLAAPALLAACRFVAKYAAMRETKGDPLPSQLVESVSAAISQAEPEGGR